MNFTRIALGILAAALTMGTARGQEKSAPAATPEKPADQAPPASGSKSADAKAGGQLEQAKLVHMVPPVYPKEAKDAGIGGTVVVKGVIAKDGSLQQVEYVSGPEELKQAAIDAVKQWQYKPEMLAGKPVEVGTTISLAFTLKKADAVATPAAPSDSNTGGASDAGMFDALNGRGPQPPPPPRVTPTRIKVGGKVMAAQLAHQVLPHYPEEAKYNHVTGKVLLHAIVGKDGSIQTLEAISGPKELVGAALDAVKQWRYKPTMLNGEPVEVDTTIEIIFSMG